MRFSATELMKSLFPLRDYICSSNNICGLLLLFLLMISSKIHITSQNVFVRAFQEGSASHHCCTHPLYSNTQSDCFLGFAVSTSGFHSVPPVPFSFHLVPKSPNSTHYSLNWWALTPTPLPRVLKSW